MLVPRTLEGWVEMNPDLVPKRMSSSNIMRAIRKDPKLTQVQKDRILREYIERPEIKKRFQRMLVKAIAITVFSLILLYQTYVLLLTFI